MRTVETAAGMRAGEARLYAAEPGVDLLGRAAAEVARAAISTLDLGVLLTTAVDLIGERFGLDYVGIYLLDAEKRFAVLRAATGPEGRRRMARDHRLKLNGASTISRCIMDRRHLLVSGPTEDSAAPETSWIPGTHSEIALPLITRDVVIGALSAQSHRPGAFSSQDVPGFQIMADQLASAIENARLYADARHQADDLALAYIDMGLNVSSTPREVRSMPDPRAVALTFDDGPHPLITPWILDQLDKEHVKATFFLVGKQATLYPELVREICRRGHQIGSHSYAHYSLRFLSEVECEQDLVKSRLALREACGQTVELFRPPGGFYDGTVRRALGVTGFTGVFWTCNITSYPGVDGQRIAADLGRRCATGGIVLLHNGEDETLDTLPYLIPELKKRGLRFVTIKPDGREVARATGADERGR